MHHYLLKNDRYVGARHYGKSSNQGQAREIDALHNMTEKTSPILRGIDQVPDRILITLHANIISWCLAEAHGFLSFVRPRSCC